MTARHYEAIADGRMNAVDFERRAQSEVSSSTVTIKSRENSLLKSTKAL